MSAVGIAGSITSNSVVGRQSQRVVPALSAVEGVPKVDCSAAEVLAGRICAAAARSAQSECQLLELLGEFDAVGAVGWWQGVKSLAHWLSWACSMSPGTAREHIRVAKAMRQP